MDYKILNGDCVEEVSKLKDNSIDFSIFSPPFAELYVYSDDIRDMGNSKDYNEFFDHFKFLVKDFKKSFLKSSYIFVLVNLLLIESIL